jgi:dimethylaniline monooxygenase (N-oxide forming)
MPTTVAVVGGGPFGLMALKNLVDDGFDVTLLESRPYVGGLWRPSNDDSISAAENTRFNTSKYRMAFSDFPVPEDDSMEDFPSARQMHRYLESYCDHFNLRQYLRLNSPVQTIRQKSDKWELDIGAAGGGKARTEVYDRVLFACGTFIKPRTPDLKGIERFEGKAIHSMYNTNPAEFKGKNVLVMGLHASAQDAIVGLKEHAAKVYLSHRSGVVLVSSVTLYPSCSKNVVLIVEQLKRYADDGQSHEHGRLQT